MRFSKKIILILLSVVNCSNIFSGLLPETMVFMGNRAYKRAKDLDVGDHIPIYNIPSHCLEKQRQKIPEISTHKTKELILIETAGERLAVGASQKLYNRRIKKFIPAEEFKVGDKLFSPEKGNLPIINVSREKLKDKVELYDIAVEDGSLFFILTEGKTHILVHDYPVPVSLWDILKKPKNIEKAIDAIGGAFVFGLMLGSVSYVFSDKKDNVSEEKNEKNNDYSKKEDEE